MSFVVLVRIARVEDLREVEFRAGSGIVVRVGGTNALLTARHVLDKRDSWIADGMVAHLLIRDVPVVDPEILFESRESDLVAIRISDAVVAAAKITVYEPGPRWPPRPVQVPDAVLMVGFPKALRVTHSEELFTYSPLIVLEWVASIGEHRFAVQFNREDWVALTSFVVPEAPAPLPGVSGGPVFAVDDLSLHLVGIVTADLQWAERVYVANLSILPTSFGTDAAA